MFAKIEDGGASIGKHSVFAGFWRPPMTMLHFRLVDPCDLRCAYMDMYVYAQCRTQGLGRETLCFCRFGRPPMTVLCFRLVDPSICDARRRLAKCRMQGLA